jgi:hypothetical protein
MEKMKTQIIVLLLILSGCESIPVGVQAPGTASPRPGEEFKLTCVTDGGANIGICDNREVTCYAERFSADVRLTCVPK